MKIAVLNSRIHSRHKPTVSLVSREHGRRTYYWKMDPPCTSSGLLESSIEPASKLVCGEYLSRSRRQIQSSSTESLPLRLGDLRVKTGDTRDVKNPPQSFTATGDPKQEGIGKGTPSPMLEQCMLCFDNLDDHHGSRVLTERARSTVDQQEAGEARRLPLRYRQRKVSR